MLTKTCTDLLSARRVSGRLLTRTALPIFAVGAILLAAGIYGAWRVHRLHKRGSDILSDNVASIRAAEELETVARELRYRVKQHLSSGHRRHVEQVQELLPRGDEYLDEAELLSKSAREQQLVGRMREGYRQIRSGLDRLLEEDSSDTRGLMGMYVADEVIPNKLLIYTERYIELNEEELARSSERNQSTANQLMFGLLLLGTCGGVAGLFAGYGIARLISRTMVQLAIPIRDTAGKLSQVAGPVTIAAEPELRDLESVLKTVSDHVTTVVERLQESERERLRAEQLAAVGQLAAGIAHELRNPLTSMKAILQLAEQPHDLSRRDLDVLQEEADRLEQSVQSLLDYARPPQPHQRETDLQGLLEQAVHLVQRRAERQGIEIEYAPQEATHLLADGAQLRQVVLNLLLNAIDATPRGGRIRLEYWEEASDRGNGARHRRNGDLGKLTGADSQVVIRVSDGGAGLPSALGERIFEPFVTAKATGTGLGLSICRRIVETHHGQITAHNQPQGGAVFEVRLPRASPGDRPAAHRAVAFSRE